jgi:hypothetical protein
VLGAARGDPGGPRHFGTGCGTFSAGTPPGHAPGLRGGLLRFATLLSLLSERTASEDASVRTALGHFDEELFGDDQDERRRFPGARLHSLTVAGSLRATARISAVFSLRRRLRLLGSGWQAFSRCLAEQLDYVPVRDTDRALATRSERLAANRPPVEHDTFCWSLPDILQLERDSTVDVIVAAGGQHASRRAAALSRLQLSCPPPADHREV